MTRYICRRVPPTLSGNRRHESSRRRRLLSVNHPNSDTRVAPRRALRDPARVAGRYQMLRADTFDSCQIGFAPVSSSSAAGSPACTPRGARRSTATCCCSPSVAVRQRDRVRAGRHRRRARRGRLARRCIGRTRSPPAPRCATRRRCEVLVEEGPARVRELQTAGARVRSRPDGPAQARTRGGALEESHRPCARRPDRRRGRAHARRARAGSERIRCSSGARARSRSSRAACCRRAGEHRRQGGRDHRRRDGARDGRLRAGLSLHDESDGRDRRRLRHRASRRRHARRHGVRAVPSDRARHAGESARAHLRGGARRRRDPRQRARRAVHGGRHKLAELAPRDVVARAIFREQRTGRASISTRASSAADSRALSGIFALCRRAASIRERISSRSRPRRTT